MGGAAPRQNHDRARRHLHLHPRLCLLLASGAGRPLPPDRPADQQTECQVLKAPRSLIYELALRSTLEEPPRGRGEFVVGPFRGRLGFSRPSSGGRSRNVSPASGCSGPEAFGPRTTAREPADCVGQIPEARAGSFGASSASRAAHLVAAPAVAALARSGRRGPANWSGRVD